MSMESTAFAAPVPGYPLRFDVEYPERLSRWLIFVKWLFGYPVQLLLSLINASLMPVATFFAILLRKKFPRWWFDYEVSYLRFNLRYFAYTFLLRDEYPAFEDEQAVSFEVDYPERLNRWLPLVKWILALPHYVVLVVLFFLMFAVLAIAWIAILFTGRFPKGLFDLVVGVYRWYLRVIAYSLYLMTDEYPPFSLK